MEYISTRGSKVGSFQNVLMKGLAQDGGLFIPNEWPQINTNELGSDLSYENLTDMTLLARKYILNFYLHRRHQLFELMARTYCLKHIM